MKTGVGVGFSIIIVWVVSEVTPQAASEAHSVTNIQYPAPVAAVGASRSFLFEPHHSLSPSWSFLPIVPFLPLPVLVLSKPPLWWVQVPRTTDPSSTWPMALFSICLVG